MEDDAIGDRRLSGTPDFALDFCPKTPGAGVNQRPGRGVGGNVKVAPFGLAEAHPKLQLREEPMADV